MYKIKKRLEIAGSHQLDHLPYDSKCKNIHGHNWIITVYCQCYKCDLERNNGMVIDFSIIKKKIHSVLDHQHLNDIINNPTAENIAYWVFSEVPKCYRVDVQESEGNTATYEV